jgi:alpha-D-ribose 1-methylphosphonate 5-triphosphate diphosphatase PhnM
LRDPEGTQEQCAEATVDSLSPEITKRGHSAHPELGIVEFEAIGGLEEADFDSLPGAWLHREMQELASTGSSPLQALQAVTYNAALYMGKLDQYGVIERGRIADMVLLDENPLADIRNTEKIAAVVLRGSYVSHAELDAAKQRANIEQARRLTQ